MTNFFTLIYIKTNRFSDEKFCVGVLANINGVPYFGFSQTKLNVALGYVNKNLIKAIKRSFGLLENDVNKIIRGEEALSLFDLPYTKHILGKLTMKKRGVVQYSDLYEVKREPNFEKLYSKFVGEPWQLEKIKSKKENVTLKKRFHTFVSSKNYLSYSPKYRLLPVDYPLILKPFIVDLIKKDTHYIVYQTIDFSLSITTIQTTLNKFRLLRQSITQKTQEDDLKAPVFYLVYESQTDKIKQELIEKVRLSSNQFKLLKMTEM
jgi:hypothetical protein